MLCCAGAVVAVAIVTVLLVLCFLCCCGGCDGELSSLFRDTRSIIKQGGDVESCEDVVMLWQDCFRNVVAKV